MNTILAFLYLLLHPSPGVIPGGVPGNFPTYMQGDIRTTANVQQANNTGNTQQAGFNIIDVTISQWGHTAPAIIYQPEAFEPNKRYPLIVCFHGKSKAGKSMDHLYLTGILQQLKQGKKIEAVNPADKKLYKFIVLAPRADDWSFTPENLDHILDDVSKRYPIDTTRMYITGYSAGGWATVMAISDNKHLSSRLAAAVPMSPTAIEEKNADNFKVTADANLHAWYFAGTAETQFLEYTQRYVDSTNKYKKGLARLTIHDKGHCCWADFYNPKYREGGMNIYEWMLLYHR